jgi:dTDP-4-dehydrorhamnose 3,5-epimerase/reductase
MEIESSPIPGLLVVRLDVREDARGWFKENWQREKMVALGLPDFAPVQHNIAFNAARGTTRGIHVEPWDKLVSVADGRAFGAWVDLRAGETFGTTFHLELDPSVAVYIPRGVGNSYQTLDDRVSYTYLVNEHFNRGRSYPAVRLDDPALAIPWPIPLEGARVSEKDRGNPGLEQFPGIDPWKTMVMGCTGQLGRALMAEFPDAVPVDSTQLDVTDPAAVEAWPWGDYDVVLNAAAYTAVDAAESYEGRREAWAANAAAPAALARIADRRRLTVVHFSTEYVFDGTRSDHTEDEPLSPLGVYGQSKAAGDLAIATTRRHYLLRTSWVVGEGSNFVRTMLRLAAEGATPQVVDDQVGRLTFADDLARATRHLLESDAPYGTYNCTNSGPPTSWLEVARRVFELSGRDPADVSPVSTTEYAAGRSLAPRPLSSTLDLARLEATGFTPRPAWEALSAYVAQSDAGNRS